MPMLPPAPGRFSITTGSPSACCSPFAIGRAMMSVVPPGGYGTMSLSGFAAEFCAAAERATKPDASASRMLRRLGEKPMRALSLRQARHDYSVRNFHHGCDAADCRTEAIALAREGGPQRR